MQTFTQNLIQNLLGPLSLADLLSTIIFILIGATLNIALDVATRDRQSTNTPEAFSFRFFWRDNRLRIAINIALAILTARFLPDLTGLTLTMFWAFALGLVFDWLLIAYREIQYRLRNQINNQLRK